MAIMNYRLAKPDTRLRMVAIKQQSGMPLTESDVKRLARRQSVEAMYKEKGFGISSSMQDAYQAASEGLSARSRAHALGGMAAAYGDNSIGKVQGINTERLRLAQVNDELGNRRLELANSMAEKQTNAFDKTNDLQNKMLETRIKGAELDNDAKAFSNSVAPDNHATQSEHNRLVNESLKNNVDAQQLRNEASKFNQAVNDSKFEIERSIENTPESLRARRAEILYNHEQNALKNGNQEEFVAAREMRAAQLKQEQQDAAANAAAAKAASAGSQRDAANEIQAIYDAMIKAEQAGNARLAGYYEALLQKKTSVNRGTGNGKSDSGNDIVSAMTQTLPQAVPAPKAGTGQSARGISPTATRKPWVVNNS